METPAQTTSILTSARAVSNGCLADSAASECLRVQSLRGLACLLLVAFHVIGSNSTSGMHVADDSLYRLFTAILTHLRMPLFAFLSGFVYAYHPVRPGFAAAFARKKLVRLWFPLIAASTIYFVVMLRVPDAQGRLSIGSMWEIYLFPYVHFWFLQAMILIFSCVMLLEKLNALTSLQRYGIAFLAALALNLQNPFDPDALFSIQHALYLAPFFLLGLGANRFRNAFVLPSIRWAALAVFLFTMSLHVVTVLAFPAQIAARGSLLATAIGCSGLLTLFHWFPYIRPLERLGKYSFTIYLYHALFAAAVIKAALVAGIGSKEMLFVLGVAAGLMGPMAVELIVVKIPVARQILLGQRVRRAASSGDSLPVKPAAQLPEAALYQRSHSAFMHSRPE
jgi:glucans biosynthesis protein C